MKDLEARGIARTATDLVNLARYTDQKDLMKAECIRTFPTATFPASLLLRREEIENWKISGASIIIPLHANINKKHHAYLEAPFDLLYGFRGCEMLIHWEPKRIEAPSVSSGSSRANWTMDGIAYRKACREAKTTPQYKPGVHYIAAENENRNPTPRYTTTT